MYIAHNIGAVADRHMTRKKSVKRRFGPSVVPKLRGTVQADIFKEVQAQTKRSSRSNRRYVFSPTWWNSPAAKCRVGIRSRSAGITLGSGLDSVQQAAYTLSNGFAYAEMFAARGIPVDQFGPRLSFFLDCGLDVEYIALARVSRRIWAIGMRDVFGAGPKAQLYKLHTQTSGRSLIAA